MKRSLRISTMLAALFITGSVFAQSGARIAPVSEQIGKARNSQSADRSTVSCGPDVSDYIFMKEDTVPTTNANTFYYLSVWPNESPSTAYIVDANSSVTVTGVMFVARVKPGSVAPVSVEVGLWNTNGYQPTTQLGTASVNVTATANFYQALFTTPITVTDTFAVSIKNMDATDTIQAIINNYQQAGQQEGLSYYNENLPAGWSTMMSVYGINTEFRIMPIVTYSVTSDFMAPNDTVCVGSGVTFMNMSSGLYGNRMFNQHAFDDYWLGENDSTFMWNFGDASPVAYGQNGVHVYTAPGTYTVSLTGTMLGVLDTCMDTKMMTLTVMPVPASSFTYDASQEPMVSFTDASTGTTGATYMWDFGDGNTSTAQNPTHTYGSTGTFTVTQTVMGFCGNSTTTQTVTITTVGVNEMKDLDVKAFYNAQEQSLNLALPGAVDATVEVFNVIGEMIYSEAGLTSATRSITLNGLSAGTYVVRVKTANGFGAAKFAVIK